MSTATEFLVDQLDIISHLFFASGTADRVIVTAQGRVFDGALRFPDGDAAFIACGAAMPDMAPGTTIQVEYVGTTDEYRFESTVISQASNGFRLALPRSIERSDRRVTPRIAISLEAGVKFIEVTPGGLRTYSVVDVSDGGVGIIDPTQEPRIVGQLLRGRLLIPGVEALEMALELRNVRPTDEGRHLGGRFIEISMEARAELGRVLRMWQKELGSSS